MGELRHTAEVTQGDGTTVGAGRCDSEPVPVTTTLSPSVPTACGSEERATGGGWADDLREACGRLPTVAFLVFFRLEPLQRNPSEWWSVRRITRAF